MVDAHDLSTKLFLYLAFQGVHSPAQVPHRYEDAYIGTIADAKRRRYAGMLSCVDEGVGNVTAALQARGMLDTTLVVFTADNGGPTTTGDNVTGRGVKPHSGVPPGYRCCPLVCNFPCTLRARGPSAPVPLLGPARKSCLTRT